MKHILLPGLAILSAVLTSCGAPDVRNPLDAHRPPKIEPDYSDTVIPPNIAPLNFVIFEEARRYRVDVSGADGGSVVIRSKKPGVRIPLSPWRNLLERNRGGEIRFTVSVLDSLNRWVRFDPVRNRVAREEIDGYLVYRLMPPLYIHWKKMEIVQRNLANFDEKRILDSRPLNDGCFNCHSFLHNSPDNWMVHMRGAPATGMLLTTGGKTMLVKTQTEFNKAPAGHPAWHPSGKYIAFSVYKVRQFFHSSGENRDVLDLSSDIILYRVDSSTVTASPLLADPKQLETYPNWSPDGRWLYYCSAPPFDTSAAFRDTTYKNVRYNLMRISFDPQTGSFGNAETVLSASQTGMSITFPRFSPDGRVLLFCMGRYGNFPLCRANGDLYLMDARTRAYKRLDAVNSDRPESYHSWSANGRWFVFTSMRQDNICARPYFSYFDAEGNVHKPFVLPQKDPAYYESALLTFNIPELVNGPIPQRPQKLIDVARKTDRIVKAKFVHSAKGY
jgi:hypothetical protein